MEGLQVSLFGTARIQRTGQPADLRLSPALISLLAYLLLYRHRLHSREVLLGELWGDLNEERARNCLNTALWRLRRTLEADDIPCGTYLISHPNGEVGINVSHDLWLDVAIFEEETKCATLQKIESVSENDITRLEYAITLYNGELLEGNYDDWTLRERARLHSLYLDSLAYLMQYYERQNDYTRSAYFGQQILSIEPLREEIHRSLMRLYIQSGQRSLAVRQYETCRSILEKELSIPPMPETQALYALLISEGGPATISTSQSNFQFREALERMHHSLQMQEEALGLMHQALAMLEKLQGSRSQ